MSFHIGQQVVCIKDFHRIPARFPHLKIPQKGSIYTIREFCPEKDINGNIGLYLEEIINTEPVLFLSSTMREACFGASHFRPVRKTDISIFTAMLQTSKVQA